jgi:hypothetical protein
VLVAYSGRLKANPKFMARKKVRYSLELL